MSEDITPPLDQASLEAIVAADVAITAEVAHHPGLPEWLGTECAARVLADPRSVVLALFGVGLTQDPPSDDLLTRAAKWLGRMMAGLGWRESRLGLMLARDGSGDNEHGWGPWQADIRSWPAEVAAIRALVVGSDKWWVACLQLCAGIYLSAAAEYPGRLEAGACRYNCSHPGVEMGLVAGDPNLHTTGHDYGRSVMGWVNARWPEMPAPSLSLAPPSV